jgi:hypothetical protein
MTDNIYHSIWKKSQISVIKNVTRFMDAHVCKYSNRDAHSVFSDVWLTVSNSVFNSVFNDIWEKIRKETIE